MHCENSARDADRWATLELEASLAQKTPMLVIVHIPPRQGRDWHDYRCSAIRENLVTFLRIAGVALITSTLGARLTVAVTPSAVKQEPAACHDSVYRQFDFWVGDWDVFDQNEPAKKVARAIVELILNKCVLHEIYQSTDGRMGESFSIYDASRHTWHQSWVTDYGQLLTIEGGMRANSMVLEGTDLASDGKPRQVRGMWEPAPNGVHEIAARSTDGGKSWQPWFDLVFRHH